MVVGFWETNQKTWIRTLAKKYLLDRKAIFWKIKNPTNQNDQDVSKLATELQKSPKSEILQQNAEPSFVFNRPLKPFLPRIKALNYSKFRMVLSICQCPSLLSAPHTVSKLEKNILP